MATLDKEIFDYVCENAPALPALLVQNVNAFRGSFPDSAPDNAAAFFLRPAGPAEAPDRYAHPLLQVVFRGATEDDPIALLLQVRAVIKGRWQFQLPSQFVQSITEHSSGYIGKDLRQRYEWSANYAIVCDTML